jgi:hypothetical protein
MTSSSNLPEPIKQALERGPEGVVKAARELHYEDLGLLVLWKMHQEGKNPEFGRVLAVESAGHAQNGVARASLSWLMDDAQDLGIAHTLLSLLSRDLHETKHWPGYLLGQVTSFLRQALDHPEASVKAEALSVLSISERRGVLGQVLHASAAAAFAQLVEQQIAPIAEDDEKEHLVLVLGALRNGKLPKTPKVDVRALQHAVLDVLDAADRYGAMVGGIEPLLDHLKQRALLADASSRVAHDGRALQTLRVRAPEAASRLIQTVVGFGEEIVGLKRHLDFEGLEAPDYGVQLVAAMPASVPIHMVFSDDDARTVFEVLERLVKGAATSALFEKVVADLPPTTATAFLRILERVKQYQEEIDILITDPASPQWQRQITIGPKTLKQKQQVALVVRSREVPQGKDVIVPAAEVPQANTVRQVFQAVDAMLARGSVVVSDIEHITAQRQVSYYKQGARILRFLDDDNQPTSRARSLVGLDEKRRLAITSVYFEDTVIVRAWREWAGVSRLVDLKRDSAEAFLKQCVVGLSGSTPGRRASTLRTWLDELAPHYPSGN